MDKESVETGIDTAIENNNFVYFYNVKNCLGILNPEIAHIITDDGIFINGDTFICFEAITHYKLLDIPMEMRK